jgi:hypothetical protein
MEVHVNTGTHDICLALPVFSSCHHTAPAGSPPAALRQGKGLMAYFQQTLPSTEKQKIIGTLFSRTHPERVRPGSVLTVNLTHAPTTFSGVLISVRCRGPDTSFVLRNVVQRTGVESKCSSLSTRPMSRKSTWCPGQAAAPLMGKRGAKG